MWKRRCGGGVGFILFCKVVKIADRRVVMQFGASKNICKKNDLKGELLRLQSARNTSNQNANFGQLWSGPSIYSAWWSSSKFWLKSYVICERMTLRYFKYSHSQINRINAITKDIRNLCRYFIKVHVIWMNNCYFSIINAKNISKVVNVSTLHKWIIEYHLVLANCNQ